MWKTHNKDKYEYKNILVAMVEMVFLTTVDLVHSLNSDCVDGKTPA